MLLYSTLLCKKKARAPAGHKKIILTKLGGKNRIDPKFITNKETHLCLLIKHIRPGITEAKRKQARANYKKLIENFEY